MEESSPNIEIESVESLTSSSPSNKDDLTIQPEIDLTWKMILETQAHSEDRTKTKVPIAGPGSTSFERQVLSDLRSDIKNGRENGKSDRTIYRELHKRLHPDGNLDLTPEAKELAKEFAKALNELEQIGELKL